MVLCQCYLSNVIKLSAEEGEIEAMTSLGVMYDLGQGVLENKNQAVYWYKLAAEQGHSEAQYNLAISYYKGTGVP